MIVAVKYTQLILCDRLKKKSLLFLALAVYAAMLCNVIIIVDQNILIVSCLTTIVSGFGRALPTEADMASSKIQPIVSK